MCKVKATAGSKIKRLPRVGAATLTLQKRKAGAHAHKNTKRRKTRDKTRAVEEAVQEHGEKE